MKDKTLYLPWEEQRCRRDRKLHHFITRQLHPFSPYYRRLFDENKIRPDSIRTVEDLKRIPFTSKADFFESSGSGPRSRHLDFILKPDRERIRKYLPKSELIKLQALAALRGKKYLKNRMEKEYLPVFLTATTGTTDQSVSFLYTNYDIRNLHVSGRRLIEVFDIKRDQRAVNVFPYAPHLAFWQTFFAGLSGNVFILSTGGGKTFGTEKNIQSILNVKAQFLIGVPGYVYHLLKTAREQGLEMRFLNKIALGAARVPRGFKKKIVRLLTEMGSSRISVMGTYGFTEARMAWGECPTELEISSGYHTYPDKEVFEVIDPRTGEVKREGEDGELVYTGIDARGSCVLRYRTGDLVKGGIVYSPCPHCGMTVPRISSDIYRASNIKDLQLSKIKGTLVNLNNLEYLLDDKEEIDGWQIEIGKKDGDPYEVDELVLNISLSHEVNEREYAEQLNTEVCASAEVSFNEIHFLTRKEMTDKLGIKSEVKAKKIVDKRPRL